MRKIMFNDRFGLTQAVLEGCKTQTRRIIKFTDKKTKGIILYGGSLKVFTGIDENRYTTEYFHPMYKIGEIVSVAQCYNDVLDEADYNEAKTGVEVHDCAGYNNKMFVRAELMPHQIKITNVRVQRLKDITDDECLLEGIEKEERTDDKYNYIFFDAKRELYIRERTPRDAYARLIDAISGKGTWDSNPYVFVYDFKLIK